LGNQTRSPTVSNLQGHPKSITFISSKRVYTTPVSDQWQHWLYVASFSPNSAYRLSWSSKVNDFHV